ncbi:MAG: PIN domain-containing protein [Phormidium sp. BM_Day4_Bin.17]|nr:PIN domain-containing protein [Phormidium sp. BM_Day4_Bin.17]UCJ11982.1 MAG: PIN domain-containing protein [Phormidium sp. PBR-2020]
MTETVRLCLDLNIWCAYLLASAKGRQGSACQSLVEIVRQRYCAIGSVELVISWGMLNRLQQVLEDQSKFRGLPDTAAAYVNAIQNYGQFSPSLTLGGTGIIPIQDVEDRHVLETALAGRATALVTANFKDFIAQDLQVIIPNRHGIYRSPRHHFHVVHPYLMIQWLNDQHIPPVEPLS